MLALGDLTAIGIVTAIGLAQVAAMEWQHVLVAAGASASPAYDRDLHPVAVRKTYPTTAAAVKQRRA
jgi:hypothetical protein